MEKLRLMATRHGLACLEHEKPFEYVNGSGKHNNWSICADGKNLLEPGAVPSENLQFLVFLAALVAAVDEHADLLRMSVASAGNDHRLGANEAPPAIISVFLGDQLHEIVEALIHKEEPEVHEAERMDLGVPALPDLLRDTTDRNRTSPFAFTGNKFEFRMCGSQQNLADPNVVLNTAVAEQCDRFATKLEGKTGDEFTMLAMRWVRHTLRDHQRVLFEGNGYSEEWEAEAERRGLPNLKTTPDTLSCITSPETVAFYSKYNVLNEAELHARYVSKAEQYAKLINIEANTMVYMARHLYLPALFDYSGDIASSVATKAEIGIESPVEKELVRTLTDGISAIHEATADLEANNAAAREVEDPLEQCFAYRDNVLPSMAHLRECVDAMEKVRAVLRLPRQRPALHGAPARVRGRHGEGLRRGLLARAHLQPDALLGVAPWPALLARRTSPRRPARPPWPRGAAFLQRRSRRGRPFRPAPAKPPAIGRHV